MTCPGCGNDTVSSARFCSNCGRPFSDPPMGTQSSFRSGYPRLVRPRYGRVFGGVCAGFAQTYGWDVVLVRLVLAVFVVFGCGTPLLAYLIAWIVIPNEPWSMPSSTTAPPTP